MVGIKTVTQFLKDIVSVPSDLAEISFFYILGEQFVQFSLLQYFWTVTQSSVRILLQQDHNNDSL